MLMEVTAKNCYIFSDEMKISLVADMRTKKLSSNVYSENNINILKTIGIYGSNNVGKTCLLKCIQSMRNTLLNKTTDLKANFFTNNDICELGITFLEGGKEYRYSIKYDAKKKEYVYERFAQIIKDNFKNTKEYQFFVRDNIEKVYECEDSELKNLLPHLSKTDILIYLIDSEAFEFVRKVKSILVSFASRIDIVNMNNIPMDKTLKIMKNENNLHDKVVCFIKNADVYLENFTYVDNADIHFTIEGKPAENVLKDDFKEKLNEWIRLVSVYKGHPVPSIIFDSTGTKKIAALASYIIEALEQDRILIIDELDSSLHFKLTRAIVAMFNNELNTKAQMIFTVHDISLLDCKKLFRKEQIWFIDKDEDNVYVYSLADFTAEDGIRDTTDVFEKYRKGMLGAIPDPEFINTLLSIKGNTAGGNLNEQ